MFLEKNPGKELPKNSSEKKIPGKFSLKIFKKVPRKK